MKMILAVVLLFGNVAFADDDDISVETRDKIMKTIDKFKKDCPALAKAKTISAVNLKNKTSEYVNKEELAKAIGEHFDVTIDPQSKHVLDAVLSSSSSETKKKKVTKYSLSLKLTEDSKQRCDYSYSVEITELTE